MKPFRAGVQNGINIRNPNKAPTGSACPKKREPKSFFLLPVA
jgi:hypothetical protein